MNSSARSKKLFKKPANSSKTGLNTFAQWMMLSCSGNENNHSKAWGSEKELGMGIEPIIVGDIANSAPPKHSFSLFLKCLLS